MTPQHRDLDDDDDVSLTAAHILTLLDSVQQQLAVARVAAQKLLTKKEDDATQS